MDVCVQHRDKCLDSRGANAGISYCEGICAQQHHRADNFSCEGFSDAAGMTHDEVFLKCFVLFPRDDNVAEFSESSSDPVTDEVAFDTVVNNLARSRHSGKGIGREFGSQPFPGNQCDFPKVEGGSVDLNRVHPRSISYRGGGRGTCLTIVFAMIRSHRTATMLGFAVAFLWGMSFLSIKVALTGLSPMTLAFSRFAVASALLPLIALVLKQKLAVRPRDLPLLSAGGFVGVTLYFFFENNGILRLSASESSLIIGTIPVVTILAERLFFGARHGTRVYAGVIASFAGVALIVFKSGGGKSSLPGFLFMCGAALSWVVYTFLTRPLSARYRLLTVTFWQILSGMIGCIPFAILETIASGGIVPAASLQLQGAPAMPAASSLPVLLNVLYLGVFASAIGYWFYVSTLETLGAAKSSVFINLIPVVSVIAAYILLGERLGTLQLAGGLVAVAGVFLATAEEKSGASGSGRKKDLFL